MFGEDVSEHPETLSRSSVRLYVFSELVAGNFVLFTTIPIRIRNWYVPMFFLRGQIDFTNSIDQRRLARA